MSIQLRGGNQLIDAIKVLEHGGIKQSAIVADLGCGTSGHFIFPAAHLVGPGGKVYAVDILPSALNSVESRKKLEGVDNIIALRADLERAGTLKIDSQSVDLVLLLNILSQINNKKTIFEEAMRIIKPGGTVLISEWKTTQTPFGPPIANRLDQAQLQQLAQDAGLKLVEKFEPGPYHIGLVFKQQQTK